MKNTVFMLGVCLLTSSVWAQSTCETRVDAHPKASTRQRVTYCLTAQPDGAALHNPGLVFSGVSSPASEGEKTRESKEDRAHDAAFKPQRIEVDQQFVPTRQFPKLTDGRTSQQEIVAKKTALQEGKQLAQEALAQSECEITQDAPQAQGVQEPVRQPVLRQMTEALAQKTYLPERSLKKPARTMALKKEKEQPVAQQEPVNDPAFYEPVEIAAPAAMPAENEYDAALEPEDNPAGAEYTPVN